MCVTWAEMSRRSGAPCDLLKTRRDRPKRPREALCRKGGAATCLTWVVTSLLMERADSAGREVHPKLRPEDAETYPIGMGWAL